MFRYLLFSIIFFALLYILSEVFKFLNAINGTNSQILKDKRTYLDKLQTYDLIDWNWSELNILSYNFQLDHSKRLFNSIYEGVFTSIFGEDIGVVISKRYGNKQFIIIRTFHDIFEFNMDNKAKNILTINDKNIYEFELKEDRLDINTSGRSISLRKEFQYAEIYLDKIFVLKTNNYDANIKSFERIVSEPPNILNNEDQEIVKFLLLFYLIWQEFLD